jgi:DNA (cytosine-5)-methyltransferase 1
MEVRQIGNMDADRENFKNPQCGRVYSSSGLSPTINTCQGGQREPKILEIKKDFTKVHCGLCSHFMDDDCNLCGCSRYDGPVEIKESQIVSMRGRNPDNPSDRTAGILTEQRLKPNSQGICNTLTSVQKDNMVLEMPVTTQGKDVAATIRACMSKCGLANVERNCEMGSGYGYEGVIEPAHRIRKLTPLECWRLMGISDEDFRKAESVNSNTQLYKQAGNSIVVDVLKAIFGQMIPERTQNK